MNRLALQAFAVPLAQISRCVVCGLEKFYQRVFWRSRGSHIVVHQQELFHLRVVEGRLRRNTLFGKATRFRRGIRVKSWPLDVSATRPKPGTADFVRVRLTRDAIRTGPLRRASSGEASDRKVKASPEKMYRTGFALKSCAELLECLIDPYENPPEFMRSFRVICRVNIVLLERRRIGYLARPRRYLHTYAQLAQGRHKFLVKIRNALRLHSYRDNAAITGFDEDLVLNEIKLHLDGAPLIRHRRGGHAACRDVEGHVPPVVHQRTQLQAHFADDLRPHMQGRESVFPRIEGQWGQSLVVACDATNRFRRHGYSVIAPFSHHRIYTRGHRSCIELWMGWCAGMQAGHCYN